VMVNNLIAIFRGVEPAAAEALDCFEARTCRHGSIVRRFPQVTSALRAWPDA
jgi:hypothetical protein